MVKSQKRIEGKVLTIDLLTSPYLQWLGKRTRQTSPLSFQNIPHFGQLNCSWCPGRVQLPMDYFQKPPDEEEKRQPKPPHKPTNRTLHKKLYHNYAKIKAVDLKQVLWEMCSTSSGQLQQSNSCRRMKQASKWIFTFQKGSKNSSQQEKPWLTLICSI